MKDWLEDLWDSIQINLEIAFEFISAWFMVLITLAILILGTIAITLFTYYIAFKMFWVV